MLDIVSTIGKYIGAVLLVISILMLIVLADHFGEF